MRKIAITGEVYFNGYHLVICFKRRAEKLITFIKDRLGHDLRYSIDATKINKELGWKPSVTFEQGLSLTIDWCLQNSEWLNRIANCYYQGYYKEFYSNR